MQHLQGRCSSQIIDALVGEEMMPLPIELLSPVSDAALHSDNRCPEEIELLGHVAREHKDCSTSKADAALR